VTAFLAVGFVASFALAVWTLVRLNRAIFADRPTAHLYWTLWLGVAGVALGGFVIINHADRYAAALRSFAGIIS